MTHGLLMENTTYLIEKIDMLRPNEKLCKDISREGQQFADTYLVPDFITAYAKTLTTGIANRFPEISESEFIEKFNLAQYLPFN